jgi:hypothetical protein
MNRHAMVPVLALLLSATARAAIDPALLALVMPEAKVLYGIQVQQTVASPFGQYAISHLLGNDAVARFAAASGFEVQRDLREILVASSTPDGPGGADALVLARGAFPSDKFIALATVTGATVSDYHGVSVITPQERGARAFAFLDSSTLAIGSERALRGVIDRRASQTILSGPLLRKAQDASATGDAWFATVSPLVDLIPVAPSGGFNPAPLLESVLETWVGLHFDASGVTLFAEALTHSDIEAQGLAGVLKLATGMVKGTPAAALQNAQVTASGPVTRITLTVAEQDLERSFPFAAPQRAAR